MLYNRVTGKIYSNTENRALWTRSVTGGSTSKKIPSMISKSLCQRESRMISPTLLRTFPYSTFLRYLGIQSMVFALPFYV